MYFRLSGLAVDTVARCGQFVPFTYNSHLETLFVHWITMWRAFVTTCPPQGRVTGLPKSSNDLAFRLVSLSGIVFGRQLILKMLFGYSNGDVAKLACRLLAHVGAFCSVRRSFMVYSSLGSKLARNET